VVRSNGAFVDDVKGTTYDPTNKGAHPEVIWDGDTPMGVDIGEVKYRNVSESYLVSVGALAGTVDSIEHGFDLFS
jgi:hypothetical protein